MNGSYFWINLKTKAAYDYSNLKSKCYIYYLQKSNFNWMALWSGKGIYYNLTVLE